MRFIRLPAAMSCRRLLLTGIAAAVTVSLGAPALAETLEQQLARGEELFMENCATCHGVAGKGGAGYANPIVGSTNLDKFRNAKRLFDYHRMMMPFDDPSKMTAEEKWHVTAYLMDLNSWLDGLDEPLGPDNAEATPIGSN